MNLENRDNLILQCLVKCIEQESKDGILQLCKVIPQLRKNKSEKSKDLIESLEAFKKDFNADYENYNLIAWYDAIGASELTLQELLNKIIDSNQKEENISKMAVFS